MPWLKFIYHVSYVLQHIETAKVVEKTENKDIEFPNQNMSKHFFGLISPSLLKKKNVYTSYFPLTPLAFTDLKKKDL